MLHAAFYSEGVAFCTTRSGTAVSTVFLPFQLKNGFAFHKAFRMHSLRFTCRRGPALTRLRNQNTILLAFFFSVHFLLTFVQAVTNMPHSSIRMPGASILITSRSQSPSMSQSQLVFRAAVYCWSGVERVSFL